MLMAKYSLRPIRPIIRRLAIALVLMLLEIIHCCRCLAGFSTRIPTDLNGGRREDLERRERVTSDLMFPALWRSAPGSGRDLSFPQQIGCQLHRWNHLRPSVHSMMTGTRGSTHSIVAEQTPKTSRLITAPPSRDSLSATTTAPPNQVVGGSPPRSLIQLAKQFLACAGLTQSPQHALQLPLPSGQR
ncbi:hypothetical protein QBC34DRAFT_138112 [Podospora aff. communis PSN243]|uniref:Secreted protein n=1 Tax=Podospora aff. communis PSN243 TaxID=3040156 RepID=A0AAV9H251_9PEZI|nr:hypothetical protein QBC34DRAFT_138112 [Podospora aff. communis PSN243]